jgi:hypothetical protein
MSHVARIFAAAVLAVGCYATTAAADSLQYSTSGVFCTDAAFTQNCSSSYTEGGITITYIPEVSPLFDVPPPSSASFGEFQVTGSATTFVDISRYFRLTVNQTIPTLGSGTFDAMVQGTIKTGNSQAYVLFSDLGPTLIGTGIFGVYSIVERDSNTAGRANLSIPGGTANSIEAEVNVVPEPGSMLLLGTGLLGLAGAVRRRFARAR